MEAPNTTLVVANHMVAAEEAMTARVEAAAAVAGKSSSP